MGIAKKANLWYRWDKEILSFKKHQKHLPLGPKRHWRRTLLFIFMEELSKNLLHEEFDIIIEKIIEAIQFCFDFTRVRFYIVDRSTSSICLRKTSSNHWPNIDDLKLNIIDKDGSFKTLNSRQAILENDSSKLNLEYRDTLKIEGPYAVIPLFIEEKPFGLICADMVTLSQTSRISSLSGEYIDQFDAFSQYISSAIENRLKIEQLELIDRFAEIILHENEKDKLLQALMEYSCKLVNASGGHLKLYNHGTKKLERVADFGADTAPPQIKHKPMGIGFSNWVFSTGNSLLLGDTTKHPLMIRHKEFCKNKGYFEYNEILEKRKSALLVPLRVNKGKPDERIIGVIDLHSSKLNQFSEIDRDNILALVSSVIIAIDKSQQMERLQSIVSTREKYIEILKRAVEKAYSLDSVLKIIRDSCYDLQIIKDLKNVCLIQTNPPQDEPIIPNLKCFIEKKDCRQCLRKKSIIKRALSLKILTVAKDELAIPILYHNQIIGILFLQCKNHIFLTEDEGELLKIVVSTTAILLTTSKNYENKIKQITTIYEAGQLSTRIREFSEWFHPLMEKVMDDLGRNNRNFHLVLVEHANNEIKLFIRETSALYINNEPHRLKTELLDLELPIDGSVSGYVITKKKIKIIKDVQKFKQKKLNDPIKFAYYEHDDRIKSEAVIPLIVKEGTKDEIVIGCLVIDSILINDFKSLDLLRYLKTISNYLAITIRNEQLYEERAQYQEELLRTDRRMTLTTLLNFFYHEFSKPLQEMQSTLNLIGMDAEENKAISNEIIHRLNEMVEEQYSIFNKFVNKYFKPFPKMESKEIRQILNDSLIAVEKTRGLDIELSGNYLESKIQTQCYPDELELAFRVIISNAIKYSKGINKSYRYLKIEISEDIREKDQHILVSFESRTTEQIPSDKLSLIFEPYIRGTDKAKGIGLGLALADMCIKHHMGEIKAENFDKDAVKFTIKIPKI